MQQWKRVQNMRSICYL